MSGEQCHLIHLVNHLLAQFSLYVHKSGPAESPDHFIFVIANWHFPVWEMWDFGILTLRNNKPSEQWTHISDEWPFGTMNLYFGTMNFRNNKPSEQWTPISDKWPFGPINLRHNKPFFSEQWTFGTMNLRSNEPSEKWTFGKADCNHATSW